MCSNHDCYRSMSEFTDVEFRISTALLYVQFVVYGLLAMYLYQIVPQNYGVAKKWNYLCKGGKPTNYGKPGSSLSYDFDEIRDLEEDRESNN